MNALKNINAILEPVILGEEDANQGHMIKVCKELPKIHEALERGGGEEEFNRMNYERVGMIERQQARIDRQELQRREYQARVVDLRDRVRDLEQEKINNEDVLMAFITCSDYDFEIGRCGDCNCMCVTDGAIDIKSMNIIEGLDLYDNCQYCEDCVDTFCQVCRDCGEYRLNENVEELDGGSELCVECLKDTKKYVNCDSCSDYKFKEDCCSIIEDCGCLDKGDNICHNCLDNRCEEGKKCYDGCSVISVCDYYIDKEKGNNNYLSVSNYYMKCK